MKLPVEVTPDEFIEEYNLELLIEDGYVYIEIRRGMNGLLHAG